MVDVFMHHVGRTLDAPSTVIDSLVHGDPGRLLDPDENLLRYVGLFAMVAAVLVMVLVPTAE